MHLTQQSFAHTRTKSFEPALAWPPKGPVATHARTQRMIRRSI